MQGVFIEVTSIDVNADITDRINGKISIAISHISTLEIVQSTTTRWDSETKKFLTREPFAFTELRLLVGDPMFIAETPEEIQNMIPKAIIEYNAKYLQAQMEQTWKDNRENR